MTKWNAAFPDKLKEVIKETDEMIAPKLAEIDEPLEKKALMRVVC